MKLVEQVETLAQSKRQNPVGVDMLVSRAKRYLAKPEHRIQLSDLISDEVECITERLDQDDMGTRGNMTPEEFQRRIAVYEGATEGLSKVCGLVGRWGDQENIEQVIEGITALVDHAESERSGLRSFLEVRGYPAVLAYQGAALGLMKSSNWQGFRNLLLSEVDTGRPQPESMFSAVSPMQWKGGDRDRWNNYYGTGQNLFVPMIDRLHDEIFASWGKSFMSSMGGFTTAFLLSEMLTAFFHCEGMDKEEFKRRSVDAQERNNGFVWMPIGRACWDRTYQERVLPKFENENFKKELLNAGFLKGEAGYLDLAVKNYTACVEKSRWWYR
ncbi:hypothetical protein [Parasedimentitalea psychrophila]|uniref:Uncharacterized protein n=1 Tax=Parasedimentitalea psychrophila TaxID=2997337 RepID=A0A9Y2KZ23_9RHOB|nr:hypothetical protein [Parasedimentitalea psychrophila]WIY24382.1 hypothetical protein QPJ95_17610 [Parasedimentitalea psychrophila]